MLQSEISFKQNLTVQRHSRGVNRAVRLISLAVGFCLSISIFFFNFSIAGFGAGLLPFGILGLYSAFLIYYHAPIPPKNNAIKHVFMAHAFYLTVTFLSFFMNGSMTLDDVRYLASNASNIFWWPILYIIFCYRTKIIYDTFKIGYMYFSYVVILFWLILFIYTGDLFFLRYERLPLKIIQFSVFFNPNQFCRIVNIAIIILFYFYIHVKLNSGKKNKLLLFSICSLVFMILTSLSRANIFALLFLGIGLLSVDDSYRLRSSRQLYAIGTVILIVSTIFLLLPEVLERFEKGARMLSYFFSVISATSGHGIETLRIRTWIATINIIRDNPLYGVGFASIEDLLQIYGSIALATERFGKIIEVHGGFLKIMAYGGFLSLVPFLFFYFLMLWKSLKTILLSEERCKRGGAYLCSLLLFILIPVNIGADCFGLSYTWMSIAFLFILGQMDLNRVR